MEELQLALRSKLHRLPRGVLSLLAETPHSNDTEDRAEEESA